MIVGGAGLSLRVAPLACSHNLVLFRWKVPRGLEMSGRCWYSKWLFRKGLDHILKESGTLENHIQVFTRVQTTLRVFDVPLTQEIQLEMVLLGTELRIYVGLLSPICTQDITGVKTLNYWPLFFFFFLTKGNGSASVLWLYHTWLQPDSQHKPDSGSTACNSSGFMHRM